MTSSTFNSSAGLSPRRWLALAMGVAAGVFGCLLAASEYLVRVHVEPQDVFVGWARDFLEGKADQVAIGDSITQFGFIGSKDWSNLARGGMGLEEAVAAINILRERRTLRRVIIGVTYSTLERPPFERDRGFAARDFYADLFRPSWVPFLKATARHNRAFLVEYWRTALVKGAFVSNAIRSEYGHMTSKVVQMTAEGETEVAREAAARNQRLQSLPEDVSKTLNARLLNDLLTTLQREGIQGCVVAFPVHKVFREAIDPVWTTRIYGLFEKAARQHGAAYADLFSDAVSDEYENFADFTHLSRIGAERAYSEILRRCGFQDAG